MRKHQLIYFQAAIKGREARIEVGGDEKRCVIGTDWKLRSGASHHKSLNQSGFVGLPTLLSAPGGGGGGQEGGVEGYEHRGRRGRWTDRWISARPWTGRQEGKRAHQKRTATGPGLFQFSDVCFASRSLAEQRCVIHHKKKKRLSSSLENKGVHRQAGDSDYC